MARLPFWQPAGDAYLRAHHPVYQLAPTTAANAEPSPLASRGYKSRVHPDHVDETPLASAFASHAASSVASVAVAIGRDVSSTAAAAAALPAPIVFAPLYIIGLDCLREGTECLGDCPDAAYFGPHIQVMSTWCLHGWIGLLMAS